MSEQFSYVVGKYYDGIYQGCVNAHCYHTQVQHGTMEDALAFLRYVESRNDGNYKIFILTELQ